MNFDIEIIAGIICRTCLGKDPVFEISHELWEKLKLCAGIGQESIENKKYPSKICNECLITLEISFEFRRLCHRSDKRLRSSFQNSLLNLDKYEDSMEFSQTKAFPCKKLQNDKIDEEYNISNSSQNGLSSDTEDQELNSNIQLDEEKHSKINTTKLNSATEVQIKDKVKLGAEIRPEAETKAKRKYVKRKNSETHLHKCQFCEIRYVSKSYLNNHIFRIHPGQPRFNCKICGDSYVEQFQLKKHIVSKHSTERSFKCEQCDRTFLTKALRNKHIQRLHTRPFKCDQCGKFFGRKDNLKAHMRVHTGERPFVCEKCGARFKERNHLRTHNNKSVTQCTLKLGIKVEDELKND